VGTPGHQCVIYLGQSGVLICHSWGGRKCKGGHDQSVSHMAVSRVWKFFFLHYDLTF